MLYHDWTDPLALLHELRRAQQSTRGPRSVADAGVYPAVNIYDDGDAFMVRAEVPGLDKSKLDILVKGSRVSIRGERAPGADVEHSAYHRREREMGVFHRVVTLPEQVDSAATTATYNDGVLEVVCPRAEAARAHQVSIS